MRASQQAAVPGVAGPVLCLGKNQLKCCTEVQDGTAHHLRSCELSRRHRHRGGDPPGLVRAPGDHHGHRPRAAG